MPDFPGRLRDAGKGPFRALFRVKGGAGTVSCFLLILSGNIEEFLNIGQVLWAADGFFVLNQVLPPDNRNQETPYFDSSPVIPGLVKIPVVDESQDVGPIGCKAYLIPQDVFPAREDRFFSPDTRPF